MASFSEGFVGTAAAGGMGEQQEAVIDVEAKTAALAQPWGRRLWEWAQAAGMDAAGGFYVAKPSAVGRGGRPGDNVMMARGLPAIVLAAQKLLAQVRMVCPCSTPEIQSSCSVAGFRDAASTSLFFT